MNLDNMILSLLIFLPIVALFIITFIPKENTKLIKTLSVLFSTVIFVVSLHLWHLKVSLMFCFSHVSSVHIRCIRCCFHIIFYMSLTTWLLLLL